MASRDLDDVLMAAGLAARSGNWRLCADKYLAAYSAAADTWPGKYNCWSGFCSVLTEDRFVPSALDFDALANVAKDRNSPLLDRAQARFASGYCKAGLGDREGACRSYRRCIELIESATADDRSRSELLPDAATLSFKPKCCGPIFDDLLRVARDNLAVFDGKGASAEALQAKLMQDEMLGVKSHVFNAKTEVGPNVNDAEATLAEVQQRLAVGGSSCDACGASPFKRRPFKRCSQCNMAYYCDSSCQKLAWKAGHKQACRKPGQVEVGDWMRIDGLVNRQELNGLVVEVIAPIQGKSGSWEVSMIGGDGEKPLSVAAEKLLHLRPKA